MLHCGGCTRGVEDGSNNWFRSLAPQDVPNLTLRIVSSTLHVKWSWRHSIFGSRINFGTRQQPFFSISKDSKKADHRGRLLRSACSDHFWEVSAETVRAVVQWELAQNSTFAVANSSGERAELRQHCGLPIGGHLSATLVELVAL